jgi:hypothetical protein
MGVTPRYHSRSCEDEEAIISYKRLSRVWIGFILLGFVGLIVTPIVAAHYHLTEKQAIQLVAEIGTFIFVAVCQYSVCRKWLDFYYVKPTLGKSAERVGILRVLPTLLLPRGERLTELLDATRTPSNVTVELPTTAALEAVEPERTDKSSSPSSEATRKMRAGKYTYHI